MGSGSVSPPISFASSIDLGGRTIQQDAYIMLPNLFSVSNKVYHVFGIFDGHGSDGHKASEQAKKSLEKETLSRKELIATNPHQAILEIFVAINQDLSNEQSWDSYLSGTTAVVAIIVDNQVHFGSVGDSRLVIISEIGGELVYKQLTRQSLFSYRDHTAAVESERQRLEAKGARLEQLWINGKFDGPLRIFKGSLPYPGITVSRSLGDTAAQRIGVICTPECSTVELSSRDKYLILATDGLWDGISSEEVQGICSKSSSVTDCSERLLKAGLAGLQKNQIDDNITNIVISITNGTLQ